MVAPCHLLRGKTFSLGAFLWVQCMNSPCSLHTPTPHPVQPPQQHPAAWSCPSAPLPIAPLLTRCLQCSSCPFPPGPSTASCESRFPRAFPVPSPAELGDPFPFPTVPWASSVISNCVAHVHVQVHCPPTQATLSMSGGGGTGLLHLPQPSAQPSAGSRQALMDI